MFDCVRPIPQLAARREHSLLDTADPYDAWQTGREGPQSADDSDGLKITYDGTGMNPSVSFYGPDGEIELRGTDEIRAAYGAMRRGLQLAEAFGDPIPEHIWRRLNA